MKGDILVLPGGGAKGAVQFGMIEEYIKMFGYPECILGTSVGSLNGPIVASKEIDKLNHIWFSIKNPKDIIKKRFMSYALFWAKSSIYSAKPLKKLIERNLDIDKLRSSDVDFYACVWNANTNKAEIFSKHHPHIKDAVLASACIPIIFNEIVLGNQYYFDGGITDQAPTKFIFSNKINTKPRRITILSPSVREHEANMHEKYNKIPKIGARIIDGLTKEGKHNDIDMTIDRSRIASLEKRLSEYTSVPKMGRQYREIETLICYPTRPNMETLDFYPDKIREGKEIGKESFIKNTIMYSHKNHFQGEKINWSDWDI
jgi:NTE family protein